MDRVIGCGVDIEEPDRFHKYLDFRDGVPGFIELVFTAEEISRNRDISPHITFALGFSCKEAVFKAFGRSWTHSAIDWKDIELVFHDTENLDDHEVRLGGYARDLYEARGCRKMESFFEISQGFIVFGVLLLI